MAGTESWALGSPVRRVECAETPEDPKLWPFTIPAVRQLLDEGLDLGPATVLVGENGSGKSTVVEAIAEAYGMNPEGGSTGAMHVTTRTESPLSGHLRLVRGARASRKGYFLRAETMHGLYTYLDEVGFGGLHERSHGESFLELIETRCYGPNGLPRPGLYLFDEVESALSFTSCLRVLAILVELSREPDVQVVLATHSPVLAALPGARVLQLDADGFHDTTWDELDLVRDERLFLADPRRFLRHF
ncbi:AAA family ATPase [Enemella sp. A6]|uniref:AAA family ATPase n=1 Tax=Enemella sp. A6 TaxID=3440152 RepID=UPI003EBF6FBF